MTIALLAAFPHEFESVIKNCAVLRRNPAGALLRYASHDIVAVLTGMGRGAVSALKTTINDHSPGAVISIGFAGALYEGAKAGGLVWGSGFLNFDGKGFSDNDVFLSDRTAEFDKIRNKISIDRGCIVTVRERTEKKVLKEFLPEGLAFPVCDMETFQLAKAAQEKGVPFFAIRAVTDTLDEEIHPEFFNICAESGNYSLSRSLGLMVRKPGLIPEAARLYGSSKKASGSLWHAVKNLIESL